MSQISDDGLTANRAGLALPAAPGAQAPSAARRPAARSRLREELDTAGVLVRRDVTRFVREKSRVAGALLQPLIFWVVIGSGMSPSFVLPRAQGVKYLEYFYPGVMVMVVLFTAIFTTMSVIEDRHSGFLQAVLVAPGSRAAVVLGKCCGAGSVAFVQGLLFALLAPVAGFHVVGIDWPLLLAALALSCFGLCALGFAVAWWLDSTAGYHVVMSLLLLPMWILSGGLFPAPTSGWIALVQYANPMSYSVSAVRRALYDGALPAGTGMASGGSAIELAVLLGFGLISAFWAIRLCYGRR
jgi:ABC-2 type transport system permease protein